MPSSIQHIAIFVKDMDESVAFYQRIFDLRFLAEVDPGPKFKQRVVNLTDGTHAITLVQPTDRTYRDWEYETFGVNHIGFMVDSIDTVLDRLANEPGVTGIERLDINGQPVAKFRDINGTEIDVADSRYHIWDV